MDLDVLPSYVKNAYEDEKETLNQSIEDRKSFLIDFLGVPAEFVENAVELANKWYFVGEGNESAKDYDYLTHKRTKLLVESPKGLRLRPNHDLYDEFYGLVYCIYQLRYVENKLHPRTTYKK